MNKLKVSLILGDKEGKGYEPSVSLTVASNTTMKDIKNFRKFYLNYHHNANLEYENIILERSDDHYSLLDYTKDSDELTIKYYLHV